MAPRILRREKMLEKIFKLKENNTTARTEIIAGLTTFMTMAYIIALNPNLLTGFGKDTMPELWNGVFLATCIASAIGTIVMAFLANKPFAMAPGMGLNSFFAVVVTNIVALTGMTYENLKFYCKEGLVPNVKRDSRNYRVFDDHDIKWIQSLGCLRNCGLSIAEMKEYLHLCLEGESSIPARKDILSRKKEALLTSMQQLQEAVDYIDWKQGFYDDVLSGKTAYYSNLIPETTPDLSLIHI